MEQPDANDIVAGLKALLTEALREALLTIHSENSSELPTPETQFLSPAQIVQRQPAITMPLLRRWLDRREENGLAPHVHKVVDSRNLLIDEQGFIGWIKQQPD